MRPVLNFPTLHRYLALAACLAALHAQAQAAVYKCTAADGRVTFSDRPCDQGTDTMVRVPVPEFTPPPVQPAPAPPAVELPAPETLPAPKPPTQVIQIDAAELPPLGTDGAGGTGAYVPPLPGFNAGLAELCRAAAPAMPPRHAPLLTRLAAELDRDRADPARVRAITELARTLTFRHEMLQEFE